MNILVLGDVVGPSGIKAIKEKLPKLIKEKKIDFVVVNGENAAESGGGITEKNTKELKKSLNLKKQILKESIKKYMDFKNGKATADINEDKLEQTLKENFFWSLSLIQLKRPKLDCRFQESLLTVIDKEYHLFLKQYLISPNQLDK